MHVAAFGNGLLSDDRKRSGVQSTFRIFAELRDGWCELRVAFVDATTGVCETGRIVEDHLRRCNHIR